MALLACAAAACAGADAGGDALVPGFAFPAGVSPDGRLLLLKRFHARDFELLVMDRATGRARARHRAPDTQVAPAWRGDGGAVAFFSDRGGDDRYRLHLLDVATGRARALDAPETSVAARPLWSPDGRFLAYLAGQPGSGARDLVVVPGRSGAPPRRLVTGLAPRTGLAWSPDGRRVAAVTLRRPDALVLAGVDGTRRTLAVARGAELREAAWSPDGRALLVVARLAGAEFASLLHVRAGGGGTRAVAAPEGDVSGVAYLPDGGWTYHVGRDGERALVACDAAGHACRAWGGAGESLEAAAAPRRGDTLFATRTGRAAPPSLEALLPGGARATLYAPPVPAPALRGERVDVPSADGVRVPAYLWRGARGAGGGALVRVHGGPALQATPGWEMFVQHVARAGHHVILPNYRGSTGYGRALETAPGGAPARVADLLAVRDWVADSLGVPRDRIVLFGHSYGALLAAQALEREPRGFGGAVLVALVALVEGGGGPRPGCAGPLPPVAAFHGRNDALRPPAAARAGVAALCGGAGKEADFSVLAGEGHSPHRMDSWARIYGAALELLRGERR